MSEDTAISIACKYCGSPNVIKFGTYNGAQRLYCKDCRRKFKADGSLYHSKVPASYISSALSMYYGGMSLADISQHFKQEHPAPNKPPIATSSIWDWICKYSDKGVAYYNQFTPNVGDTWVIDETIVTLDNKTSIWLWDCIDADTRFLLATKLGYVRTSNDAAVVLELAKEKAGKAPKIVLSDFHSTYPEAIRQAFGSAATHIQSKPFTKGASTNLIERWHETLKERTKVLRGLRDANSALQFVDGFVTNYNFIRPHESLNGQTPAQAAGIDYQAKDWAEVVRLQEQTTPVVAEGEVVTIPALPRLEPRRATITGKPYRAGRKRQPRLNVGRRESEPQVG